MTDLPAIDLTQNQQPRSIGQLVVSVAARSGASGLSDLRQSGALKALFPTARGPAVTAVCINTGGGIAGGDRFTVEANAQADASLVLTTQAAERIYRAAGSIAGRMDTRLSVGANGTLDWLPQETILFDGARLRRRLSIEMDPSARFLMVEPVVFGRHARGEVLRAGAFSDRVLLRRGGSEIFRDGCDLSGDIAALMARRAIGGGAGAMALVALAAPDVSAELAALRAMLPASAGVTMPRPGLLVCRVLAEDGFALRTVLIPVLERLSGAPLPPVWRF
ncbi:urease accessory protein UreD [Palleronia sp. LCG004]|uniref:urease accessory protein UreD n=1 Tax=Palleronia sp. LCG004 TaxID=3079304 RepID=UPI0029421645|nr:urease accessory protein UreD [Palleronia sp. LCG004]WOI55736.1 urease accessory protein UreD [Palleronia sp. LCG004]